MDGIRVEQILSTESCEELIQAELDITARKAETIKYGRDEDGNSVKVIDTNLKERDCDRTMLHHSWFPEVIKELEDAMGDGSKVSQFDLLRYGVGGFFLKHEDESRRTPHDQLQRKLYERKWSVITLLDKSDDLIGGDLIIYKDWDDEEGTLIEIDKYQSVIFPSKDVPHEITEVTRGSRLSLVSWLKMP